MTALTLEALRENPWNVITQQLPDAPDELLLQAAYLAAEYCKCSEYALMNAARRGRYTPSWFTEDEVCPDAHEESEERGWEAEIKMEEIGRVYEQLYGDRK